MSPNLEKLTDEVLWGIPRVWRLKMSNAVEVNDATFESQIEQHKGLAVVDFWATWCAPCRMVAPVLDQLAVEYEGKAKVAKVDVDVNIKTSTKFNVRSIPAILFFKDGKLVDQVIGFVGKPALAEKFKQYAA
jgi:thioredoxin